MSDIQLTIYVNEADMHGEMALHEFIVCRLLHLEIAGTTVTRGVMGFGKHGQVHRNRLFGVSDDQPIVIVAVDDATRIRAVLPELKALVREGLITWQEVEVICPF